MQNSYDTTPYKSYSFASSNPLLLEACATFFGISAPPTAHSRILEIGSSFGGNLIPFAIHNPFSFCHGIDLGMEQINKGKSVVEALKLKNVKLECMDVAKFTEFYPDAKYDYIICHGVFSWVPKPIQKAILEVIAKHLNPNGVAYISYNIYPGWKIKDILRKLMLKAWEKKQDMAFVRESLMVYDEFLEYTSKVNSQSYYIRSGDALRAHISNALQAPDYYLMHEFLETCNNPMYFDEFASMLGANELSYIGECDFNDVLNPDIGFERADKFIQENFNDHIQSEFWFDLFLCNVFRRSIITHKATKASLGGGEIGASALAKLNLISKFNKTEDGFTSAFGKTLSNEFNWLYDVFTQVYPASISLADLVRLLDGEARLSAYAGMLRVLDTVGFGTRVSIRKYEKIDYKAGATRVKPALMPYLEYFASTSEPVIGFSDEFGTDEKISSADAAVAMKFDGINSKADIEKYLKKQIKSGKFKLGLADNEKTKAKDDELVSVYVNEIENLLSAMHFFEYFDHS